MTNAPSNKELYSVLNTTIAEVTAAMAYLMSIDDGDALRLWGRLEQAKFECERLRDELLAEQYRNTR